MGRPSVGQRYVNAVKRPPIDIATPPLKQQLMSPPSESLLLTSLLRKSLSPVPLLSELTQVFPDELIKFGPEDQEEEMPSWTKPEHARRRDSGTARALGPSFAAAANTMVPIKPSAGAGSSIADLSPSRPMSFAAASPFRPLRTPEPKTPVIPVIQQRSNTLFTPQRPKPVQTTPQITPEKKGYRNLGNTCYINAMLSAITNVRCFVNDLVDLTFIAQMRDTPCTTLKALTKIVRQSITTERSSINPAILKDAVARHKDSFNNFQQQDAHEFFLAVLDQVHEEVMATLPPALASTQLTPHTTPSPVQRNFEGAITHELTCLQCRNVTQCVEVFYALSLSFPRGPISEGLTTQDLLKHFLNTSTQESKCEKCGHMQCTARHCFSALPRVLVLHVQRSEADFAPDKTFVGHTKRTDPCAVSFMLDMDPHCTSDVLFPPPIAKRPSDLISAPVPDNDAFNSYSLRAFAIHLGEEATGGHYKCLVEQSPGQWMEYDDEDVTPMSQAVAAAAGKQNAYLLFYEFSTLLPL